MAAAGSITPPPRGLTVAFIEALRPAATRYEVPDRRAPGLRLRVLPPHQDSEVCRKVFRWHCTARSRVYTIGPWASAERPGHVTLAQARDWLERLKAGHAAGTIDQVEAELRTFLQERPRLSDPSPADRLLLRAVAGEFYSDDIGRNRKRPEEARKVLDLDILPALGGKPIDTISTLDCRDVVKRTVARGAPVHAGKVLALMKQLFNWAQANGFTDRNPAAPLRGRHLGVEVNVSDRWLTDKEIPIFWAALDANREPATVERRDRRTGKVQRFLQHGPEVADATRAALRLLLLTGVRSGELLLARWEHVDFETATWTIPVSSQKLTRAQERTAKPFLVPLAPEALAIFRELHALAARVKASGKPTPWVMASDGSDLGHFTDKALGRAMKRLQTGPRPALVLPGGEASPHDLRRTMRTHLGKLRVPLHVVERCLNHSLGRIVQTYDQGDYLDERREALETWDAYVARLVAPGATNVIPIVAREAR